MDYTNITIGWSSDLSDYYVHRLSDAVSVCAKTLPGCRYILAGTDELAGSNYTADAILEDATRIMRNDGLVIDMQSVVWLLSRIASRREATTDGIILFTGQKIKWWQGCGLEYYSYHDTRNAIITLHSCIKYRDDFEQMAALMLKHVMGDLYLGRSAQNHCIKKSCAMSTMDYYDYMVELANAYYDSDLNCFCDDCQRKLRASEYWRDYPSIVVRQ